MALSNGEKAILRRHITDLRSRALSAAEQEALDLSHQLSDWLYGMGKTFRLIGEMQLAREAQNAVDHAYCKRSQVIHKQ